MATPDSPSYFALLGFQLLMGWKKDILSNDLAEVILGYGVALIDI